MSRASEAFEAEWQVARPKFEEARASDKHLILLGFLAGSAWRGIADAKAVREQAAELEADARIAESNPLSIVYQAHEVLRLQERRLLEAIEAIQALDDAPEDGEKR